ncbi:MAG: signal peptidase [Pseudomonadota bacterium]
MNFQLVLFLAVVVTGLAYMSDLLYFKQKRKQYTALLLKQYDSQISLWKKDNINAEIVQTKEEIQEEAMRQPWWLEFTAGIFPVILIVFLLRSFIAEPFKIPSGSMMPTLLSGDFILVNKFSYGLRLPVINKKIVQLNDPQKGDIVVFRYPKDETTDYIKRVVGVEGDKIEYRNKTLIINDKPLNYERLQDYYNSDGIGSYNKQFTESIDTNVKHNILVDEQKPNYVINPDNFPFSSNCSYTQSGFTCVVPKGHYFVMGDNRDDSLDSRYWGFVPDKNLVGKAFFIWLNINQPSRIGSIK